MTSVNTNYSALVALQSLNQTTKELADVQNHINTGLKVASAADNGAVFAIAEGQRARARTRETKARQAPGRICLAPLGKISRCEKWPRNRCGNQF